VDPVHSKLARSFQIRLRHLLIKKLNSVEDEFATLAKSEAAQYHALLFIRETPCINNRADRILAYQQGRRR
ncbi:hypothetical protein ACC796_36905, partial [Rhizobium ruizarguesonis]